MLRPPRVHPDPVHRAGKILSIVGLVFIVAAVLFRLVVPAVAVKYPGGSLDKTAIATGSFTLYVDPATAAPRSPAQQLPLRIERRLHVIDNSGSRSVVQEDDAEFIGPLPRQLFEQRYVVDRKSVKNVSDSRAYAYTPQNGIDRSPNYSINLPFDSGKGPYSVWKNETGSAYPFTRTATLTRNGVKLDRYHGSLTDAPVQSYYIAQLAPQGIPTELSPAQVATQLKAQGVDPALLTSTVLPQLDPADRAEVSSILSKPVPLDYRLNVDTNFLVEPRTGAIVGLERINQLLKARPSVQGIGRIQAILAQPKYASKPAVVAGAAVVQRLVANPPETQIFRIDYGQTPASLDDLVTFADGRGDKITMVKTTIPLVLLGIGVVLAVVGLVLLLLGRRHGPSTPAPTSADTPAPPPTTAKT